LWSLLGQVINQDHNRNEGKNTKSLFSKGKKNEGISQSKYLSMILANGYSKSAKQKNNEKSVEHYYSLFRFFKQSGDNNQVVLLLLLSIAYLSSL
jgi:hypothetical protein